MIEWIIEQQGVLTLSLVLLVVSERLLTNKFNPKFAYGLWWLVPLVLLFNNIPQLVTTVSAESFSRYVVSVNPVSTQVGSNWLLALWIAGAAVMLVFVGARYFQLYRSVRNQDTADNHLCYSSPLLRSPIVLGVLSPKVVIPKNFQSLFCKQQQQLVLEHEKTHIQHGDHLWNTFALILLIVFWFNPMVWLGARSFRVSQELACDEQVLKNKNKQQKILYAKALLNCADHYSWEQSLLPSMSQKNTLLRRLTLMKQPTLANKYYVGLILFVALAFSVNTVLSSLPVAQDASVMINNIDPTKRVEPLYPQAAADNEQEGSVILTFDISSSGKTKNIEVVQSFPQGVFDSSALDALAQWEYQPYSSNDIKVPRVGLFVQLDFRLYPRDERADEH